MCFKLNSQKNYYFSIEYIPTRMLTDIKQITTIALECKNWLILITLNVIEQALAQIAIASAHRFA